MHYKKVQERFVIIFKRTKIYNKNTYTGCNNNSLEAIKNWFDGYRGIQATERRHNRL